MTKCRTQDSSFQLVFKHLMEESTVGTLSSLWIFTYTRDKLKFSGPLSPLANGCTQPARQIENVIANWKPLLFFVFMHFVRLCRLRRRPSLILQERRHRPFPNTNLRFPGNRSTCKESLIPCKTVQSWHMWPLVYKCIFSFIFFWKMYRSKLMKTTLTTHLKKKQEH